jgi:hypothetical protein
VPVTDDVAQLVATLERCRDELHAVPGVVGSGVGLQVDKPVIEVYIAGRGGDDIERLIREIADFDFVLVPESQPAEAQTPEDAKE